MPIATTRAIISNLLRFAIWVVVCIIGFVAMYFLLRYMMKISKEVKGLPQNQDKMAWAKDQKDNFCV